MPIEPNSQRRPQNSQSQSNPKLKKSQQITQSSESYPAINHSCQRLPLALNPSFINKYTSQVRSGFLRFLSKYPDVQSVNESILMERYAIQNKLNYKQSNDIGTRTMVRQLHVGMEVISKSKRNQQKSHLRYFKLDDSVIHPDDVDNVMNHKKLGKNTKLDEIPLDMIFQSRKSVDHQPFKNTFISQSQKITNDTRFQFL